MDFVKNAMHKNEGQPAAQDAVAPQGAAAAPQAQGVQKDDYVDKGNYFSFSFPPLYKTMDKRERIYG